MDHPPGNINKAPGRIERTLSIKTDKNAVNALLSCVPAGICRHNKVKSSNDLLTSIIAFVSGTDIGNCKLPKALEIVEHESLIVSSVSLTAIFSSRMRINRSSNPSASSAMTSTNAICSHTASKCVGTPTPPNGPVNPALSSAPLKKLLLACFVWCLCNEFFFSPPLFLFFPFASTSVSLSSSLPFPSFSPFFAFRLRSRAIASLSAVTHDCNTC